MPSGHCSTNIGIPSLTRVAEIRNASTGSQHDQNIVNHFNFVSIRAEALKDEGGFSRKLLICHFVPQHGGLN
jgi:hypothetical protein